MVFLHDQGCFTIQIVGHLHTPYLMSCWKTLKRWFLIRPENVRPAIAGLIYFQFRRNLWYLPKCRHQTIANHSSMGVRTFFSIWAKPYVLSFSQCNANIVQIDDFGVFGIRTLDHRMVGTEEGFWLVTKQPIRMLLISIYYFSFIVSS